jgi:hypothetical protein
MSKVVRAIASIMLAASGGGCWIGPLDNPAQYVQRSDTITASAGNAKDVNAATHTVDPWPPSVADRKIPANGARMTRSVDRYQAGQAGAASQTGPQVIGIPVGAAAPSSTSSSTAGSPPQ